jgi:DNA gyrase/topoisomerase IV subunit A
VFTATDVRRKLRQGTTVMKLREKDSLCYASTCEDMDAIVVACSEGKVVMFAASEVRQSGRSAAGVIAKKLGKGVLSCLTDSLSLSISQLSGMERTSFIRELEQWYVRLGHADPRKARACFQVAHLFLHV